MEMVNFYGLRRHWRFQRLSLIPEERTMLNLKPKRCNVLRAGRYRTHAKWHVCNCSWFYILVFMGLLWRFSTKSMRNKTASETPKVLSGQTQSNIIFGAAGYRLQTRGRSKHLDGTPCFNDLFLGLPNMEKQVVSWKKKRCSPFVGSWKTILQFIFGQTDLTICRSLRTWSSGATSLRVTTGASFFEQTVEKLS